MPVALYSPTLCLGTGALRGCFIAQYEGQAFRWTVATVCAAVDLVVVELLAVDVVF